MNQEQATNVINTLLTTHQPKVITSTWINIHAPSAYRYIQKHIRTDLGDIGWDTVISKLDRTFQKRWIRRRPKQIKQYRSMHEVRIALKRYTTKLYVFITALTDEDKALKNTISIILVRVAQKGNIRATEQLIKLLHYQLDIWIEHCYVIKRWQGYTDDITKTIEQCIRCYRFTGTFMGYLYKTLEYKGRGLRPLYPYSLDDYIYNTHKRIIDNKI